MEPEMVNEKSHLYEKHPDWIIQDGIHVPSQGRHQFMLDLAKKKCRSSSSNAVQRVLKSADISFLKWDCNRSFTDVPGDFSSFSYRLRNRPLCGFEPLEYKDFPEVLFENCASGGSRYDLGMLSYFPQSWMSDDTDSFERLNIQKTPL
jgi:alpha-galactosidase